jgi:hypothetical protein
VGQLSPKLINSKIFPDVESGFADTNPTMREETIKVMVALAPALDHASLSRLLEQFHLVMVNTRADPQAAFLRVRNHRTTMCI